MRTGIGNRLTKAGKRRPKCYNTCIRKKRRKKRRAKRIRKIKIICDTNVWYGLGDGTISISEIIARSSLVAIQVNIREFTFTYNLLNNEDLARNAIKAAFKYHSIERFEPPLIYLKKLSDRKYSYNTKKEQSQFMVFTSLIARGHSIDDKRKSDFKKVCDNVKSNLESATVLFNTEAEKIHIKIKDKKKHRSADTLELNRGLINLFVQNVTKDHGLDEKFDWRKIELFEYVLKEVLFDLETGAKRMTVKDWMDLFQLIYVQPGEKYWTRENYWLEQISKVGMTKYLYKAL